MTKEKPTWRWKQSEKDKNGKKQKETLTSQESATVGNRLSPEVQWSTVATTARHHWG